MKAGIRNNLKLKRGKREDLEPHKNPLLRGANGPITDSFFLLQPHFDATASELEQYNIKKNDPVLETSIRFLDC